ncbi:probable carboxylesterase SOBER1-like [Lactuca sativa]|uniref:probable carboxylesterase SOBER1-like n=1 Tax=Lactuca sativa TaxID=4236 RepID=UPI000CD8FD23|nr:probable carboxylesterase SOBER1-like [Lactuca sativa]
MASRSFILWLHGLHFANTRWSFPSAPPQPVTCGFVMPSWFDIQEMPITAVYPDLGHSISDEELQHMESWIISRLQSESSA